MCGEKIYDIISVVKGKEPHMKIRRYELEGLILEIPLRLDERAGIYIEDYTEYIENKVRSPEGHPVMFSGEDACPHAEEATPGGCPDCGSCRFYLRAGEHTWIGLCKNINNRSI